MFWQKVHLVKLRWGHGGGSPQWVWGEEVLTGRSQRLDQTWPSSLCTLHQTFHSWTRWRYPSTDQHDLQGKQEQLEFVQTELLSCCCFHNKDTIPAAKGMHLAFDSDSTHLDDTDESHTQLYKVNNKPESRFQLTKWINKWRKQTWKQKKIKAQVKRDHKYKIKILKIKVRKCTQLCKNVLKIK